MTREMMARDHLDALRSEWRVLLAVVPGLALTMLHTAALDLPQTDLIDALDSDHYRIQWIMGAYVLGTTFGMSTTRFVASRLGLRRAYLLAILCFTAASGACAGVSEVIWMTPFRLVQGYGTGLTISAGMVLIWRAFPVHKELAMAVYGLAVYLPCLAGAPLGGLLTAWYSWRLIFLLNLPLGGLVGLLARWVLPPEPRGRRGESFDWLGLGLLVSVVVTMNVVLDMGQYWGWLASPFFVPWFAALLVSVLAFIVWGIAARDPLINLRPLALRHFGLGLGIKVVFSINLLVLVSLLSGYQINLRGYQWWQGALVLSPAVVTMFITVVASFFLATASNRKARMFLGLAVMSLATWLLSSVDVYTAKGWQAAHMALWGAGAGLVCAPALLTTFEGLSNEQTLQTAGVFNIMRMLPTVLVGGILATLLTQRTDTNFDWLRRDIRFNRPVVAQSMQDSRSHFIQRGSGHYEAGRQTHAFLSRWVHANARAYAFQNLFQLLALVPAAGLLLVLAVRVHPTQPSRSARSARVS